MSFNLIMCKQLFYSPQSLQRHRCLHGKMRVSLMSLMQITHSKPVSSNSFSSSCSMSNKELDVPLIWCCTETTTEADSTLLYMHIHGLLHVHVLPKTALPQTYYNPRKFAAKITMKEREREISWIQHKPFHSSDWVYFQFHKFLEEDSTDHQPLFQRKKEYNHDNDKCQIYFSF